jgi:hypothetical protein
LNGIVVRPKLKIYLVIWMNGFIECKVEIIISCSRFVLETNFLVDVFLRNKETETRCSSFGHYSSSGFSFDMLHNYLKVAVRNLYQYKYFSILNAFGLAVGMTVSLLLISLVTFVRTYDDFHTHGDHIYTIVSERTEGVEESIWATAPFVLVNNCKNIRTYKK